MSARTTRVAQLITIATIAGAWLVTVAGPAHAAVTGAVANGTLTITGDGGPNTLVLRVDPLDESTLELDVGNDGTADQRFDRDTFTTIVVNAGGGNDLVKLDDQPDVFTRDAPTTVNGEGGNDIFLGSVGSDTYSGGPGNDSADSKGGDDTLSGGPGNDRLITEGFGNDVVDGGPDNDEVEVFGSDVPGSPVGDDTFTIDGVTVAGHVIVRNPKEGANHDLVAVENLHVLGFRGNDRIEAIGPPASLVLDIEGGEGDDTIFTGDGNDTLDGGAGTDAIAGGNGNDTISGGAGNDVVTGNGGTDTLIAGPGDGSDSITGGDGVDDTVVVNGTDSADRFIVVAGSITGHVTVGDNQGTFAHDVSFMDRLDLNLLGGDDEVTTGGGLTGRVALDVDGGDGNDSIKSVNEGDDVLRGGNGDDFIRSGAGNDTILAGAGNDLLHGQTGNDALFGEAGNDTFTWSQGDGDHTAVGGPDADTFQMVPSFGPDDIVIGPGQVAGASGVRITGANNVASALTQIETFDLDTFGGKDKVTAANGISNLITLDINAGDGDDTVTGGDGADRITGGPGNDILAGGRGDDSFVHHDGEGNDTVDGQDGTDTQTVNGSSGSDAIGMAPSGNRSLLSRPFGKLSMATVEKVVVNTLGGQDQLTAARDLPGVISVDVTTEPSTGDDGQFGLVVVDGTAGNDTFTVKPGTAAGHLRVASGSGRPLYDVAGASELRVEADGGVDSITSSLPSMPAPNVVLMGELGNDKLTSGANGETLRGGADADTLRGGAGFDSLFGDSGEDKLFGDAGNDVVDGGPGSDRLEGGAGSDGFTCGGPGDTLVTDPTDVVAADCK